MKVAVLTSSRADFGIYVPLLIQMESDAFFDLYIIAFGSHMSVEHGNSINEIKSYNFQNVMEIETAPDADSEIEYSKSMYKTIQKLSDLWASDKINFDYVLCLGDRYEMLSAVISTLPFGVKLAHFHGGEITTGSKDNIYRNMISFASHLHFAACEDAANRLKLLLNKNANIYNVGSLSLEGIETHKFLAKNEFLSIYNINASQTYILISYHPNTINVDKTQEELVELLLACAKIKSHTLIFTMPNADQRNSYVRKSISDFVSEHGNSIEIESFGKKNYFSAMKYCHFMLGNSSSGIIEAASLGANVINLGDRQKGRNTSGNVVHCDYNQIEISRAISKIEKMGGYKGENIYKTAFSSVSKVIEILKAS